jgi:hypothetical protein
MVNAETNFFENSSSITSVETTENEGEIGGGFEGLFEVKFDELWAID